MSRDHAPLCAMPIIIPPGKRWCEGNPVGFPVPDPEKIGKSRGWIKDMFLYIEIFQSRISLKPFCSR